MTVQAPLGRPGFRALLNVLTHASLLAALLLLPALWLAPPPIWRLDAVSLMAIAAFPLAHLIAVAVLRGIGARSATEWPQIVLVGLAVYGVCLTAIVLVEWWMPLLFNGTYSRPALATSFSVGLVGFWLICLCRPGALVPFAVVALAFAVGAAGHGAYRLRLLPRPLQPKVEISYINTSLYNLEQATYTNYLPRSGRRGGGGVEVWEDGLLVADDEGRLFHIREIPPKGPLDVQRLPYDVPLNLQEFVENAPKVFAGFASQNVESGRFRVADILLRKHGTLVQLLASHHFWQNDRQCFVMRISALEGTADQLFGGHAELAWRTLYDTEPCLPLNTEGSSGTRFEGLENGGRLAMLDEHELLFSVGDHEFDGVNRPRMLAQEPDSSYGKILKIDLDTGKASVFTSGHRNPQGLVIAGDGRIWSTEHGPRGGDELNLIREGANYGWPLVTYGTDYARFNWPLNPLQGQHKGFEQPIYAFVPSVGISALAEVAGGAFPLWAGDLLLGSLSGQTIWRVRIVDGRAILVEPIRIGRAVRDLAITSDGRIVVWTKDSDLVVIGPSDAQVGDVLISQCTGCHGLNEWDTTALGPNLAAIVGRRVASEPRFAYSDAMRAAGGRWTRERLDHFLTNPQVAVPGTTMTFPGVADPDQRATLIKFLAGER